MTKTKAKTTKQRQAYNTKYANTHYRMFSLRFSIINETEIVNWLDQHPAHKEYITSLIRKDMKKQQKKAKMNTKK